VLSATPYLLGFHPQDSLVLFGCKGTELVFHVRGDLPPPADAKGLAVHLADLLRSRGIDSTVLVGYGPASTVTPVITATEQEMRRRGIHIRELLRAADGRFWSYLCRDPLCCRPEGTPYQIAGTAFAAMATVEGRVVLPNREAVVRTLDPPVGLVLAAMRVATDRAGIRLCGLLDGREPQADLQVAGERAVLDGLARYRDEGGRLEDDEVAWLGLLLQTLSVRDYAWQRIDTDGRLHWPVHERLWLDLLTRCEPELAAPVGVLLGYTLWRSGDGLRAGVAIERALRADPAYSAAHLMASVLQNALPPSALEKLRRQRNQPRSRGARRRRR
jgi:hypothetical protein